MSSSATERRAGSDPVRILAGLIALVCLVTLPATPQGWGAEICFTARDNHRLSFDVIQQAPPPVQTDDPHYPYYPLTGAASANVDRLSLAHDPGISKWLFQWANRCQKPAGSDDGCGWNAKGNLGNPREAAGEEKRSFFSTIAMANACTLAQVASALGANASEIETYRIKGLRIEGGEDRPALRSDQPLTDTCELALRPLPPDINGIVLDYEVQDRRSPAETLAFLTAFAELVHARGKRTILFSNPLDAPTQRYTGMDSTNANRLAQLFDGITVMLWSGNRQHDIVASFNAQMAELRAGGPVDPRRIFVVFELNGTSMADARRTRELILNQKLAGIMLWRNRIQQGGACDAPVNQKLSCLLFGECP